MNKAFTKISWWIFGGLSVLVGLYPISYFIVDRNFGLLSSKSPELLSDQLWNIGFYTHITLGGIALLIGWTQFSTKLRKSRIKTHRTIGKVYIVASLISGICGVFIAQSATGGITNVIGFSLSGIIWLASTSLAYSSIRNGNIDLHSKMMIYSYAVCFSAVTLRIWLPILISITGEFNAAYKIVGWLSWVPNVMVAYFINNRESHLAVIN